MSPAQLNSGRPPFLSALDSGFLRTTVRNSTPTIQCLPGIEWTGTNVRKYIQREFNVTMTIRHCQRLLKEIQKAKI